MHHGQRALNRPARGSIALGLALAASGCANQAPQPAAAPAAISYDGTYTGTLRATGSSTSLSLKDCATDPRFSAHVTGNRFSFPLPHPALVEATPSLRDAAIAIYEASIAPDGTIKGISISKNTIMDGRVAGTRMTGEVYGLLCYYAFTADRN
jgi:hypothetical protein